MCARRTFVAALLAVIFAAAFALPHAAASDEPCLHSFNDYGDPLAEVTCLCGAGNAGGAVWGTLTYAGMSNICAAAQHAGALPQGGEGSVALSGTDACPAYLNSILGGVTSQYLGFYDTAFHFPTVSDGACPDARRLGASKGVYEPGEAVTIRYSGLPDAEVYRVAVVLLGMPDDALGERWDYTYGKHEGSYEAGPLPDGQYEARLYPDGASIVLLRHGFLVGGLKIGAETAGGEESDAPPGAQAKAEAERQIYRQGEPITLRYSGLPGNAEDLIAVVPQGTPDDVLGANWHSYTYGNRAGWFMLYDLPAGAYEVRSYFDGVLVVRARSTFTVE